MEELVSKKNLERKLKLKVLNAISEVQKAEFLEKKKKAKKLDREVAIWTEALEMLEEEPAVCRITQGG